MANLKEAVDMMRREGERFAAIFPVIDSVFNHSGIPRELSKSTTLGRYWFSLRDVQTAPFLGSQRFES